MSVTVLIAQSHYSHVAFSVCVCNSVLYQHNMHIFYVFYWFQTLELPHLRPRWPPLTFDLYLQSQVSYGHDPYTCKRSTFKVSWCGGNKLTDRGADATKCVNCLANAVGKSSSQYACHVNSNDTHTHAGFRLVNESVLAILHSNLRLPSFKQSFEVNNSGYSFYHIQCGCFNGVPDGRQAEFSTSLTHSTTWPSVAPRQLCIVKGRQVSDMGIWIAEHESEALLWTNTVPCLKQHSERLLLPTTLVRQVR